jgi:hypothetical protein
MPVLTIMKTFDQVAVAQVTVVVVLVAEAEVVCAMISRKARAVEDHLVDFRMREEVLQVVAATVAAAEAEAFAMRSREETVPAGTHVVIHTVQVVVVAAATVVAVAATVVAVEEAFVSIFRRDVVLAANPAGSHILPKPREEEAEDQESVTIFRKATVPVQTAGFRMMLVLLAVEAAARMAQAEDMEKHRPLVEATVDLAVAMEVQLVVATAVQLVEVMVVQLAEVMVARGAMAARVAEGAMAARVAEGAMVVRVAVAMVARVATVDPVVVTVLLEGERLPPVVGTEEEAMVALAEVVRTPTVVAATNHVEPFMDRLDLKLRSY